jgi:glycosyltransferase involved in cell wall biosynthesis
MDAAGAARPHVVAVLPALIPSTILGVVKPLVALEQAGRIRLRIVLELWARVSDVARADVVVFARNGEPLHGYLLEAAVRRGRPVIYELDDDLFELPVGLRRAPERDAAGRQQLERYVRTAALVRVYSRRLLERVSGLNPRACRVEAPVDWSLLPPDATATRPRRLRLTYATSRDQDHLAALFLPALEALLARRPGRVEAWFWGYCPPVLRHHRSVRFVPFDRDYDRFFRRFARSGLSIGLAPLLDDRFHQAKSDNKFREYAACRIAGVYSDTEVYRERVEHGRTGLLVPNRPEAWLGALERLVDAAADREQIQGAAHAEARARYSLGAAAGVWLEHIRYVQNGHAGGEGQGLPAAAALGPEGSDAPLVVRVWRRMRARPGHARDYARAARSRLADLALLWKLRRRQRRRRAALPKVRLR